MNCKPLKQHHTLTRRSFIKSSSGAAAIALGASSFHSLSAASSQPPNILFILTDQQHIDTISANGCSYVNTPAMDWIKKRGISFEQSYCPNPVCSPSRSCIFTGRTASETGVYVNGKSIREDIPNLGQWFSEHSDYETVYAGKWHLPSGFTHFIPGFNVLNTGIGGQGNVCDTGTSYACEGFLRNRSSSNPFLMVASFMQPHDICEWLRLNEKSQDQLQYGHLKDELPPLPDNFDYDSREPKHIHSTRNKNEPSKGKWEKEHWRFYRWSYYRHIEQVDAEIGRVLRVLEETGQDKNTVIVFTSDHGEGLGHHQMVRKSMPYDEASKVPLIVSYPGYIPENRNNKNQLVSGLDIMPTFCDFARISSPPYMRGTSLVPVLTGEKNIQDRFIVTEIPGNRGRVVRTQDHKYICYAEDSVDQLFDMKNDSGETENLAPNSEQHKVIQEHRSLLKEWEGHLDTVPTVPNRNMWQ